MFLHQVSNFGDFKLHTIVNSENGDSFSMVPAFGCCLTSLQFGNAEMLDGYKTAAEMVENHWSKSAVLAPFPNRLRDGEYEFWGKKYRFPINNAATNNAIHGFAKNAPFKTDSVCLYPNHGTLTASWHYDGSNDSYPFPFWLKISFKLTNKRNLEVSMSVRNQHVRPIPMGLGWHPYFSIAGASADDMELQMPNVYKKIEIDERMLPTGEKTDFSDFKKMTSLKNKILDNGFTIGGANISKTILKSKTGQLTFWQETGDSQWHFLQVFTPPHRKSVAIEPMSCNIDAFNNQNGLKILDKNATFTGKFGVQYKAF